jgi:hypothetical protein
VAIGLALGLGLFFGMTAWRAFERYGVLADPNVAIVPAKAVLRSVPTEADVPQEKREIPPGTVARVDREFLGWVRLVLPSGETGWLRSGEATGVYRRWGG